MSVTQRQKLARVLKCSPNEIKKYERSYEFNVISDDVIDEIKSRILRHETIKTLSNSYYQYAVTNGAKAVQEKKLAVSGIDGIFNGAFISDDVGYAKPSKEFFNFVLDNIPKASNYEIMIVGDSLTSDIKGGNNMGFKTCWFNPHHLPLSKEYSVDYQIDNIDSIFDALKQENS